MDKICVRIIALVALVVLASGFSAAAGAGEELPTFQQLDSNQDGYISQDEAQGCQTLADCFSRADTNQDNQIDQTEYELVVQAN